MISNFHTHTWRCRHASGTEREYIEKAIGHGMRVLGFSDHTPYPFPDGHDSGFRMKLEETAGYFRTLTDLKKEYADQIQIHVGVEAEYYPDVFPLLLDYLKDYPCEYMILGQHMLGNEEKHEFVGLGYDDPAVLTRYVDQVLEGVATGKFLYLAHPDMFHWTGDREPYRREMERLCRGAKALDCPLEVNFLGLYDHRNYPTPVFWEIAGQVGNTVVLGVDAHEPGSLDRPDIEARALALVEQCGLKLKTITQINK